MIEIPLLESQSTLTASAQELKGRTAMVVGAVGTGKTWLARRLVRHLAETGSRTALVSADLGQPSIGVPTCLAVAISPPWDRPAASWFIGDISPVSNLIPTVVGTARLVEHARREGAKSIVIDTSGLVDGAVGRLLKYHKAVASGVERVVAIQRRGELRPLLALLDQPFGKVVVCQSSPEAKSRSARDRKAYRERRYRAAFALARRCEFDARRMVGLDWALVANDPRAVVTPGSVVGLLSEDGFCLATGIIDALSHDRILVSTSWHGASSVARIQVGRVRIDPHDFTEKR